MPNIIDATGITIQTVDEILSDILNGTSDFPGMYSLFGPDINVDPNSPDGQLINIFAQATIDMLELAVQIYNSFDPDQAVGVSLNARCAINGVVRMPGTKTAQVVNITVDRAVTLAGLDTAPTAPFTVSDATGNQYQLTSALVIVAPGVYSGNFSATLLGPVSSAINTINKIVTTQLGVVSVNNTAGPTLLGLVEESDFALRIRRSKSVSLPSQGYLEGLIGALTDIAGVVQASVYENITNATDADGIPAHSIWVLVDGGADADIANAIYLKRNAGCGMKGVVSVNVLQVNGTLFAVKFDRPTSQNLWLSFSVAAIGTGTVDPNYIRTQILAQISYRIGQQADVTTIVAFIRSIVPNAVVSAEGVSPDNVTYSALLSPTGKNYQFKLASTRIIINGVPGV